MSEFHVRERVGGDELYARGPPKPGTIRLSIRGRVRDPEKQRTSRRGRFYSLPPPHPDQPTTHAVSSARTGREAAQKNPLLGEL